VNWMWANANSLLAHTGMRHEWVVYETHEFDMHGTDVITRSKKLSEYEHLRLRRGALYNDTNDASALQDAQVAPTRTHTTGAPAACQTQGHARWCETRIAEC